MEDGLFPRIITGSSAGSIIASMICTRSEKDFIKASLFKGINHDFFNSTPGDDVLRGLIGKVRRLFKTGSLHDSAHLQQVLRENLGDITFLVLELFNITTKLYFFVGSIP